jgi:hypothetical protein
MPEELVEAYGTTVNGMWASHEHLSDQYIQNAHAKGNRALFSVPLIALTPHVYNGPKDHYLVDEACLDIDGSTSLVPWYYWEAQKVYSICFYSEKFRGYLLDRCRAGIMRGMDVVNLDEINTSLGLMNRKPGGSGFCNSCLSRFREHARHSSDLDPALAEMDDQTLRQKLHDDDALYEQYHRFHELEAYRVAIDFVTELRAIARQYNPDFAITANLAYLGNLVPVHGDLWGLMWGELFDFVMMENVYQPDRDGLHLLLPRGKFSAWYRLGSAFSSRAPVWICPSINVPKQMAGEKRATYYTLMFLEAYANNGRWGYYWWPGVDVETRAKATAPEQIKDYTRFLKKYRHYFEYLSTRNSLAILYLNSAMRERPEGHFKYLALAQALAEAGYQYDVIYGGDGVYTTDELDVSRLCRYKAVLVPEAGALTPAQKEALSRYASEPGSELIQFARNPAEHGFSLGSLYDEAPLYRFWKEYRSEDREQIAATISPQAGRPIRTSHPLVEVVRYTQGNETILHILNYQYDAAQDLVTPVEALKVSIPWEGSSPPVLRWITLEGEHPYPCRVEDGELVFEIPQLNLYGLAVL